jgi:hypothetical protein
MSSPGLSVPSGTGRPELTTVELPPTQRTKEHLCAQHYAIQPELIYVSTASANYTDKKGLDLSDMYFVAPSLLVLF